jgi:hypothetical protein
LKWIAEEVMGWITLAIALLVTPGKWSEIPAGTVIPIMLGSSLNTTKDTQGKKLEGTVMQDVLLPSGGKIDRRSRIVGHVVKVTEAGSPGARIVVQFDVIKEHGNTIPIITSLLAVASAASVWDAQSPINQNVDLDPVSKWATRQVGGDIVRRDWRKVSTPDGASGRLLEGNGVMIKLNPNPEAGCPGGLGYDREQAVWVFSSAACGAYGLSDVKIASSGANLPLGEIVLASARKIAMRGGSGWLLMVVAEPKDTKSSK